MQWGIKKGKVKSQIIIYLKKKLNSSNNSPEQGPDLLSGGDGNNI